MKYRGVVLLLVVSSGACGGAAYKAQPTVLEAETNKPPKEVFGCVMAQTSMDGYVPTNGGTNDAFLELTRGQANTGHTILAGQDMSYNEGITVMASGGQLRMLVYRTNANATNNSVRYGAPEPLLKYATGVWDECTKKLKTCLPMQSDYQACMDGGGHDPTAE